MPASTDPVRLVLTLVVVLTGCSPCGGSETQLVLGVAGPAGGVDETEQVVPLESSMGEEGVWLRVGAAGRRSRNNNLLIDARAAGTQVGEVRVPIADACDPDLGLSVFDVFVALSSLPPDDDPDVLFRADMITFTGGQGVEEMQASFRASEVIR